MCAPPQTSSPEIGFISPFSRTARSSCASRTEASEILLLSRRRQASADCADDSLAAALRIRSERIAAHRSRSKSFSYPPRRRQLAHPSNPTLRSPPDSCRTVRTASVRHRRTSARSTLPGTAAAARPPCRGVDCRGDAIVGGAHQITPASRRACAISADAGAAPWNRRTRRCW